ncbi:hypothetical protein JYK22_15780 [Nonomuraea sp. RK-328]|nr:hypothetical protein [Nonomuraea sp. RK-328]
MPSIVHDTLNALFGSRPAFAVEVLQRIHDPDLSTDTYVEATTGEFNDRFSRGFYADTVITLGPPSRSSRSCPGTRRHPWSCGRTTSRPSPILSRPLEVRCLTVTEQARLRIAACTDLAQVQEWIRRAATADSLDDVLTP